MLLRSLEGHCGLSAARRSLHLAWKPQRDKTQMAGTARGNRRDADDADPKNQKRRARATRVGIEMIDLYTPAPMGKNDANEQVAVRCVCHPTRQWGPPNHWPQ